MKTLSRVPPSVLVLAAALLPWAGVVPLQAQAGLMDETDCRCVDKEGNEIENCRCFRMFEPGQFNFDILPFASSRARIGITLSPSRPESDARGARVESVLKDGPADRAGIQEGDVITHVDGRSLFDPLEDREAEEKLDLDGFLPSQRLLAIAREIEPGDEVEIRYLRDGEPMTTTLEAEDLAGWGGNFMYFGEGPTVRWSPEEFRGQWEGFSEPGILLRRFEESEPQLFFSRPGEQDIEILRGGWVGGGDYFNACPESDTARNLVVMGTECIGGLRMEELNPKLGEYFGTEQGVLVADVHEDSKLNLQAGDVILRVGDREATDPARLRRIFRSYEPDEEITLHIMRQKRPLTVTGTLGR